MASRRGRACRDSGFRGGVFKRARSAVPNGRSILTFSSWSRGVSPSFDGSAGSTGLEAISTTEGSAMTGPSHPARGPERWVDWVEDIEGSGETAATASPYYLDLISATQQGRLSPPLRVEDGASLTRGEPPRPHGSSPGSDEAWCGLPLEAKSSWFGSVSPS